MSFHVSKPSLGIWTETQSCLFSLAVISRQEKEGNALFPPNLLKTRYHAGKMWLVIYHTCQTGCKLKSCFYTLLSRDWGRRKNTLCSRALIYNYQWICNMWEGSDASVFLFTRQLFPFKWHQGCNSDIRRRSLGTLPPKKTIPFKDTATINKTKEV